MPRLTVVTYNTYRERKGRDPALDALLEERAILCLQEVSVARAWEIKRCFGCRTYLSPVMHGYEFLALIFPEDLSIGECRTIQLNFHAGLLPKGWAIRRGHALYQAGRGTWKDSLTARAAQVVHVRWREHSFRVINTHLPYEPGLRTRCLWMLPEIVGAGGAILAGDLNATTDDVFLNDLLLATVLCPAGPDTPTLDGKRIDYVLFRGGFREAGYSLEEGCSDHSLVRAELEVS